MSTSNLHLIGWATIVGGVTGVIGFIALILLFIVGEPFGTINDILAIPVAILMLPLIFALYRLNEPQHGIVSLVASVAGVSGFAATAIGSVLLVSGRISFEQSLLPGIGGFGLIGLWVLLSSLLGILDHSLPRGIALTGIILGIIPSLALPFALRPEQLALTLGAMAGQSSPAAQLSPLVYLLFTLGFVSCAGLPVWFIWIGRAMLNGRIDVLAGRAFAH